LGGVALDVVGEEPPDPRISSLGPAQHHHHASHRCHTQ
jgi:hypothetical protein